jgi:hypothetical protein
MITIDSNTMQLPARFDILIYNHGHRCCFAFTSVLTCIVYSRPMHESCHKACVDAMCLWCGWGNKVRGGMSYRLGHHHQVGF